MTFKGSQIDRRFSYAGLEKLIRGQVEKRTAEMAAKELENYMESRREQAGRAMPEPQKAARPQQPSQAKGGKMPQPLQVVQGKTSCPQPRRPPQGPSQMQPPQPKPQPTAPQLVENGGTAFTPEQWRQLQQNRTLRVIVRSREVNMLRQYWFDKAGTLQYTLIALRRREEAFTRELVTAIKGHRLTAQEQKQLYSEQGLTKAFRRQDGAVYRSRFGVVTKPGQKDMLTECVLAVQQPQEMKSEPKSQVKPEQQHKERPQVITIPPKKRGRHL